MASYVCFLLEPAPRAARWLRRFLSADTDGIRLCEPNGYHEAMVRIEDAEVIPTERGGICIDPLTHPEDDPHWPARCDRCGYEFDPREVRQLFYQQIYRTPDGLEVTIHGASCPGILSAPVGSMWYADWYADVWRGPDGRCLVVRTPGGDWIIDGPSSNGPGWMRHGEAPNITVTPSISIGSYHGWLRNGVLVDA